MWACVIIIIGVRGSSHVEKVLLVQAAFPLIPKPEAVDTVSNLDPSHCTRSDRGQCQKDVRVMNSSPTLSLSAFFDSGHPD